MAGVVGGWDQTISMAIANNFSITFFATRVRKVPTLCRVQRIDKLWVTWLR